MSKSFPGIFLVLLVSLPCLAAPLAADDFSWSLDLRGRFELNDAPSGNPAADQSFDFSSLRARIGLDKAWEHLSVHAVFQASGAYDLPSNGSFGIGPVYFNVNGRQESPSDFGLLELDLTWRTDDFFLRLGRQKWADGEEILPGVAYLDGVKKRRLGQRLIGSWDWVNVGRRFDGLSFGKTWDRFHLSGFALEPLAGGVNYEEAFTSLDDLQVYGLTLTGRYGGTLEKGEWRLFDIRYEDERPGALAAAGGAIELDTFGGSLLLGDERHDLLVWLAVQTGDWGFASQGAWAYLVEAGRQIVDGELKIAARVGLAEASGDGDPGDGDRETFFNLLPTNHKFYGSIDFSAFSNLRDLYVDLGITRGPWSVSIGLHRFELPETVDAWYGGSGAFNEAALGYAARRPAGGTFGDNLLGHELDIAASRKLGGGFKVDGGVSFFDGGDAAAEILTVDADGVWGFLQLAWKR